MIHRVRGVGGALCAALVALLAAPLASAANGGEVTVAQGMAKDGPGFKGQLSVDVGLTTGNTEMVQTKAGAVASYDHSPHTWLGSITGAYAESERKAVGEQVIFHTHYRYRLIEHLAAEVYANYAYDKFAGFDIQFATGPDLVLLFQLGAVRVDVGLGYMIQYEKYGPVTGPAAGQEDTAHRAQLYVFLEYELAPNLQFIEHAFYMPRFDSPGPKDYMMISASSLSVQFNPVLSFQNSFNLAYDVPAPLNTKKLNTQLLVGLALSF